MTSDSTTPQRPFIYITRPEDIKSSNNRSAIASYAARYKSQKKRGRFLISSSGDIVRKYLTGRVMSIPALLPRPEQSTYNAGVPSTHQQSLLQSGRLLRDQLTSVDATIFSRNFSETNASSLSPINIILNTDTSETVGIFQIIPPEEICEAVLLVVFSWLSVQNPAKYQSSVLFHQTRVLSTLRERLSQGLYDLTTNIILMCAMQTDAIFGDETAFTTYQKGLKVLSTVKSLG